jgi:hypothetical protein
LTIAPPFAAVFGRHALGRLAAAQHQAGDVDGEQVGDRLGIVLVDPHLAADAGAVDQVGDRAEDPLGLVEQAHDVGLVGHVAGQRDRLAVLGGDVGGEAHRLRVARAVVDRRPCSRAWPPDGLSRRRCRWPRR